MLHSFYNRAEVAQTLALERHFHVFSFYMLSLYMLGKEGGGVLSSLQSATSPLDSIESYTLVLQGAHTVTQAN